MSSEAFGVIGRLVEDRDLVFRFFALFSRFEYALKRAGFLRQQEKAEADWDAYANTLLGQFAEAKVDRFKDACNYLRKAPPRKQIVMQGQLVWQETASGPSESEERYILRLVATVRNNLFHGGKYPYPFGPVPDGARNRQLLESGIAVLDHCLSLSPEVRGEFEGAA